MTDAIALPSLPDEVRAALDAADGMDVLRDVVRADPVCLEAWARLGERAYADGDDIAAYAFSRVGYHRGLDVLRSNGWRPDLQVPYEHEGNRGFLLALYGLMRAAAAIGEGVEARRCREFLLQLDPTDPLAVGGIAPKDLSKRLT